MAEEGEAEKPVRWFNHYSSLQEILIVGDGDFSFSLSLANGFGSATNIVATSLDSHDVLLKKYTRAKENLENLEKMGATIMHGIDATKLKLYADLKMRKFDRIVFNFPHAGFKGKEEQIYVINLHRKLVSGFLRNARHMLRPHGEVDISHKIGGPFSKWNLEELAAKNSLVLVERVNFSITDYPGYNNKKGDGPNCDQPFPLGECCTYQFRIGHISQNKSTRNPVSLGGSTSNVAPVVVVGRPMARFLVNVQDTPGTINCAPRVEMINGFSMLPKESISNEQLHIPDYIRLNEDPLGSSSELYLNDTDDAEVRTILGDLRYFENRHRGSIMKQAQLHEMLFRLDQGGRGPYNTEEGCLWRL